MRGYDNIEWQALVERTLRARKARKRGGERGWVGNRIEQFSPDANRGGSSRYRRRFAGFEVTDSACATNSWHTRLNLAVIQAVRFSTIVSHRDNIQTRTKHCLGLVAFTSRCCIESPLAAIIWIKNMLNKRTAAQIVLNRSCIQCNYGNLVILAKFILL